MGYRLNTGHRAICDRCGWYLNVRPGASWVFVPESETTHKEAVIRCKRCTEKYGRITPNQQVDNEIYSGVFGGNEGGV